MAGVRPYPRHWPGVPGKVTKLVPFGAFVRVEDGIEGPRPHLRAGSASRRAAGPGRQGWRRGFVKVIDIDLERRRISLSLKQADEDYTEDFDPSKYGMADSYDEQGNYIFPEGFDPETQEWMEGFDAQREAWEAQYAEAQARAGRPTRLRLRKALEEDAEAAPSIESSLLLDPGRQRGHPCFRRGPGRAA